MSNRELKNLRSFPLFNVASWDDSVKPGLHETQLPVVKSVTLVSSIVVKRLSAQQRLSTTIEEINVTLLSTDS